MLFLLGKKGSRDIIFNISTLFGKFSEFQGRERDSKEKRNLYIFLFPPPPLSFSLFPFTTWSQLELGVL